MSTSTPSPESVPEDVRNAVFAVWRRRYGNKPIFDELFSLFSEAVMAERNRGVSIARSWRDTADKCGQHNEAAIAEDIALCIEALRGDTAKEDWEKRMREG